MCGLVTGGLCSASTAFAECLCSFDGAWQDETDRVDAVNGEEHDWAKKRYRTVPCVGSVVSVLLVYITGKMGRRIFVR